MGQPDDLRPRPEPGGRTDLLVVLGATALALMLRLWGLGHESIWYDEAASLDMAGQSCADLVTGRHPDMGNPAGYFLLLRGWLLLWGSGSIEAARALSAVAGALAVPAVWLLACVSGVSRRAGRLACLLVAVSPPLVYLGQEARAFALFATVATLAVALVGVIRRTDRAAAWLGFAAAGAVLVHLHYYGFFVLVVLGLDLLAWAWRRGRWQVLKLALCAAAVALAFAPWLPTFRWQLAQGPSRSEATWRQQLAVLPLFSVAGRTLVWKEDGLVRVAALDIVVALAIFLPSGWLLVRHRAGPRGVVAFAAGVPLVAVLVSAALSPMIHVHYLSVVLPALLLLAACALDAGLRHRAGPLVWVPAVLLGVLIPASLTRLYVGRHKTDWRGAAEAVAGRAPDSPAYFYEDIGSAPFGYYLPGQPRRLLFEPFGRDGEGWRRAGYLAQMRAEPGEFWFVLSASNEASRAEEDAIRAMLGRAFRVECVYEQAPVGVYLCRPSSDSGVRGIRATRP
jgi:mannosyltransferase